MSQEIHNNQPIESLSESPKTIDDLIDLTNITAIKLCSNGTHVQRTSGIIENITNNKCKGYCVSGIDVPVTCGRGANCNNFVRASNIADKINYHEFQKSLEDIY